MADNVVGINSLKPHMTGEAICLHCNHKWVAVAEVGTRALDCPECRLSKGVYVGVASPSTAYQCGCGCMHFFISLDGYICALCGEQN